MDIFLLNHLHSLLHYSLMTFPPPEPTNVCQLTNSQHGQSTKAYTNSSQILKFFGVLILVMCLNSETV